MVFVLGELVWESRLLRKAAGLPFPLGLSPRPSRGPSGGHPRPLCPCPRSKSDSEGKRNCRQAHQPRSRQEGARPARFHLNRQSHMTRKKKKKENKAAVYLPLFITLPPRLAVGLLFFCRKHDVGLGQNLCVEVFERRRFGKEGEICKVFSLHLG